MLNIQELLHLQNERIVYHLRHHWSVYVFPTLTLLVLAVIPFVVIGIVSGVASEFASPPTIQAITAIGVSIYYMSIWTMYISHVLYYYLDMWIVTTHHIVYIEQKSLFFRTVSQQPLSRVQDVTSEVKGVFSTLLGYGNISVQTAGATGQFRFTAIANPGEVSRAIFQLVQQQPQSATPALAHHP